MRTLPHRVTLQSPAGSRNAVGERLTTWVSVATVFAKVSPLSVRDLLAAGQIQSEVTHRVRLRYSPTISAMDASWRVLFGTRVLILNGPPRNIEERNVELELLCSEGIRDE